MRRWLTRALRVLWVLFCAAVVSLAIFGSITVREPEPEGPKVTFDQEFPLDRKPASAP